MSYLTLNQVRGEARFTDAQATNLSRKSLSGRTTIFLSHSHQDADLILPAMNMLLSMGLEVYVDWLDPAMPSTTSAATAAKLKEKIVECQRFVVLLSENSVNSKWVPWELGYADGKKPIKDIGIFPIKRNSFTLDSLFDGLEYMELYPVIKEGVKGTYTSPAIFPPDRVGGNGKWLAEGWLKSGTFSF